MGPGGVMGRAKENAAAAVHNLVATAPCQRPLRCVSSRTCRRRRAVCCVSMSTGCGARQGGLCIPRAPCCSRWRARRTTSRAPWSRARIRPARQQQHRGRLARGS
jgi:hypothetical protein